MPYPIGTIGSLGEPGNPNNPYPSLEDLWKQWGGGQVPQGPLVLPNVPPSPGPVPALCSCPAPSVFDHPEYIALGAILGAAVTFFVLHRR